jgi:hypothetical protein
MALSLCIIGYRIFVILFNFYLFLVRNPQVQVRKCRSASAGPQVSVRMCRSASIGPQVSVRKCRSASIGPQVQVRKCRSASAGPQVSNPQVQVRKCRVSKKNSPLSGVPVSQWSGKKNPLVSVVEFNTHHRAPLLVQKRKKNIRCLRKKKQNLKYESFRGANKKV